MAENNKPKSALTVAIENFTNEAESANVIRKEVIAQLREDVKKLRVSEFDKAMMITAKMSINSTLLGALKDCEDAAAKRVKMELSRTEQESNGNWSQAVVQLLKMVRADNHDATQNAEPQKEEDIQAAIEKRGEELKIKISDGELESCAGLPGDIPAKTEDTDQKPTEEN